MALKKFNAVSGFSVGNDVIFDVIDDAANVTANNLVVTAVSNFGDIGNVKITGGTSGQFLQTDGTGNLFWTTGSGGGGGGTPGGVTTEVQFNDGGVFGGSIGFTYNKSSNVMNVTGTITRDNKNVPTYAASLTAPTSPKMGDLWYDTNNDIIYQYIFDGTSSAWVDTTSGFISAAITPSAGYLVQRDSNGNIYSNGISGTSLTISTNSVLGNTASANYFLGDGSFITNLTGTNIVGNVSNAVHSYYSDVANSIVGTNVSGNVSNAVHSYYSDVANSIVGTNVSGNVNNAVHAYYADVANSVVGTNVSGNVSNSVHSYYSDVANSVTGANVSGQVSNALVAGTVYTNAQPNITSVGTLTTVVVSGNAQAGNILTDNILYANGSPYTFTTSAAGNDTEVQFNSGGAFTTNPNFTFDTAYHSGDGLLSVVNLNVSGVTDIGSVSNLKVTGGYAGYVMTTDGSGNLSWIDVGASAGAGFISINRNLFVGDNSAKDFTLSSTPTSIQAIVVNIDGLVQQLSAYTLSGAVLSFATPPATGQKIEVTVYGAVNMTGTNTQVPFNDGGQFGTSSAFTFDKTSNTLSITGNVQATNIIASTLYGNVVGNISGTLTVPGSNTSIIFNDGGAAGASDNLQFNKATSVLTVTGNVTANYFSGNGSLLSNIAGANVNGTVSSATTAGTVTTNAQPNITSVGTLSSLTTSGDTSVGGNLTVTGNLTVSGTTTTVNSTTVNINDINIVLANNATTAAQANGAGLTINGASASLTYNNTSNAFVFSHNIVANGSLLTNITGGNVNGQVGNALVAGTVYTNAQPNITSVGTLTSLNVSGNVSIAGGISSNKANVSVTTNTIIDQFATTSYRSAKYHVSAKGTDGYQSAEVLLVHDGSNSYITIYGSICSNNVTDIVEFSSNVVSGNVRLYATTGSASTTVNLIPLYITD